MNEGAVSIFLDRDTNGQCHSGVVQWQAATGMSERELVSVSGGRTVQNRGLVHTL